MSTAHERTGATTDGVARRRRSGWTTGSDEDALLGLEQLSHVEAVFRFHRLSDEDVTSGARHPGREHRVAGGRGRFITVERARRRVYDWETGQVITVSIEPNEHGLG